MDLSLSWVDLLMFGVLGTSLLIGLWRGFVFELMSIAGWFVAYFACPYVAPFVAPFVEKLMPTHPHGPLADLGHDLPPLALVIAFFLVLVLWGLSARLVQLLVRATPLSLLDRLFGAGFGALRGVLLCTLLVAAVSLTPAVHSPTWQASRMAPAFAALLQMLQPLLPAGLAIPNPVAT